MPEVRANVVDALKYFPVNQTEKIPASPLSAPARQGFHEPLSPCKGSFEASDFSDTVVNGVTLLQQKPGRELLPVKRQIPRLP